MACHETPIDCQWLRETLRRERVFYEIFLDLTWQPADMDLSWFEIALHAETEEYKPAGDPRSREAFSVLMDLAEFLIQQIQAHAPYEVDLSASYYTLHPPACGDFRRTRLSRSLSLVFFNVAPYRKAEEPVLLTEIQTHLSLLGISRLEMDRMTDAG
jgi:hypothetical protein